MEAETLLNCSWNVWRQFVVFYQEGARSGSSPYGGMFFAINYTCPLPGASTLVHLPALCICLSQRIEALETIFCFFSRLAVNCILSYDIMIKLRAELLFVSWPLPVICSASRLLIPEFQRKWVPASIAQQQGGLMNVCKCCEIHGYKVLYDFLKTLFVCSSMGFSLWLWFSLPCSLSPFLRFADFCSVWWSSIAGDNAGLSWSMSRYLVLSLWCAAPS